MLSLYAFVFSLLDLAYRYEFTFVTLVFVRQRWPNIMPTLGRRLVFSGNPPINTDGAHILGHCGLLRS